MFKLLAFSEIIFQELKLTLPKQTYQSHRRKQKMISSRNRKCNDYKSGSLKNINVLKVFIKNWSPKIELDFIAFSLQLMIKTLGNILKSFL